MACQHAPISCFPAWWQAHALDVTWSPAAAIYTTRVWHEGDAAMQGNSINGHMHAPQAWLDQVRESWSLHWSLLGGWPS